MLVSVYHVITRGGVLMSQAYVLAKTTDLIHVHTSKFTKGFTEQEN